MRVEDLHHGELLELDPDGGMIRFAGRRALLLDAVAMGSCGSISSTTSA
jgi:two-component system response regulator HydG